MKATIKYLILTIKHKWFVLLAGMKLGVPIWRLLLHDMSKFYPSELPHYGRQFFGKADNPKGFIHCWLKHQNRNKHHWEFWIPRTGHNRCTPPYKDNEPIPMPNVYIKEMVADWMGASRAYEGVWTTQGRRWPWLENNFDKIRLHPETRRKVTHILVDNGFMPEDETWLNENQD